MTCCPTCGHAISEKISGIIVNEEERLLMVDGHRIHLTPHECRVIEALIDCHPRTAGKGYIMDRIYGIEPDHPAEKIVDVRVCRMRQKLSETRVRIDTIWGKGFRLVAGDDDTTVPFQP